MAGFDVDGQTKAKINFVKFGANSTSKVLYDFEVKRVGDDPMVVMMITEDNSQWGCKFESFEVTLNDKKSTEQGGW